MENNKSYCAKMIMSHNGQVRIRHYNKVMGIKNKIIRIKGRKRNSTGNKIISKSSIGRSYKILYELISNNIDCFRSLITLTFKDDIEDYREAINYLRNFFKSIRRGFEKEGKEFKYIGIPEIQGNRAKQYGVQVIHFHLITNIEPGSFFMPKNDKEKVFYSYIKKRWIHLKYYDLPYWKYGFSSGVELQKENSVGGLAKYFVKYFLKGGGDGFFNKRKIIRSKNLKKDIVYYIEKEEEYEDLVNEMKDKIVEVYVNRSWKRYKPQYTEYVYEL